MTDSVILIETKETVVVSDTDITVLSFGIQGPAGATGNQGNQGITGADGLSAYQIAVANGFIGTEGDWLASLVGAAGDQGIAGTNGLSAYQIALSNGFIGTESAWLASLVGAAGDQGIDGRSAYEVAVANGFIGTEGDWLASLVGATGAPGTTNYNDLINVPSTFPPSAHQHSYTEVTGLGDAATKNVGTTAGTVAAGDHNHTGVYSEASHNHAGVYSETGHNHDSTYAPIAHDHIGLAISSGITRADIELPATPTNGHVLTWDATSGKLKPAAASGGGGNDPAGWVEIERIQWSVSVAFIDINLRAGQYKILRIVGEAGKPLVSGGNSLHFTISTDNGATFVASGYRYNGTQYQDNANPFNNGNTTGTTGWQLGSGNPHKDALFIDLRLRPSQNTDMNPVWAALLDFDVNNRSNNSNYGSQRHIGTGAVGLSAAPTTMRIRMTNAGAPMTYGDLRLMGVAV